MIRAVLLDSFGTLVRMDPPGPHLRRELRARAGVDVGEEEAAAAFEAEIRFYLEHHLEGRDAASLEELRDRCAAVLADALPRPRLEHEAVRGPMLASLRFAPFPEAPSALRALRAMGLRLVVASNWDCSLAQVLSGAGLGRLVDGVVASAQAGAAKPDPALFEAALRVAGCGPGEALHVGDSPELDVAGALRAGLRAVLLQREPGAAAQVPTIQGLDQLPSVISQLG